LTSLLVMGLGLGLGLQGAALAQADVQAPSLPAGAASAPREVLARDLREEVLRTQATVKDMYGREETRPMPITVYRPPGDGPFPLVVFNHGRAVEAKRATQGRYRPEHVARYFVDKGFVVMVPVRIDYWETYGSFDPEYSGSCNSKRYEPMSVAASTQVLAAVEFAKTLPYVDSTRWLVAGQSVGGLTAVATVGRAPTGLLGGINFAGGAGGEPDVQPWRSCAPQAIARYWRSIAPQAQVPMLWLYWANDKYWGAEAPKAWHQAWTEGGATARLVTLGPSGQDGHNGLGEDMDNWLPEVEAFLVSLGFQAPAIVRAPAASGFADVKDLDKVPVRAQNRAAYAKFLSEPLPRAFAIADSGGFGWASGDYAVGRALGICRRSNTTCKLYAVDNSVVWAKP
jgi:dienelactone hydrolase